MTTIYLADKEAEGNGKHHLLNCQQIKTCIVTVLSDTVIFLSDTVIFQPMTINSTLMCLKMCQAASLDRKDKKIFKKSYAKPSNERLNNS